MIDGRPPDAGPQPGITLIGVTPGLRAHDGLHDLRGRDFTASEGLQRTPVALVNETMARRFWKDRTMPSAGASACRADNAERRVVHRHRRRARRQPLRDRAGQHRAAHGRVRALRVSADAQYGPHDSRRRRRSVRDHVRGARGDSRVRSEHADLAGAHDGREPPARLLAVRPVRLDLRHDRRRRPAARVGRRVRRAVVLGVAAHAGDRRPRRARRRSRRRRQARREVRPAARRDRRRDRPRAGAAR